MRRGRRPTTPTTALLAAGALALAACGADDDATVAPPQPPEGDAELDGSPAPEEELEPEEPEPDDFEIRPEGDGDADGSDAEPEGGDDGAAGDDAPDDGADDDPADDGTDGAGDLALTATCTDEAGGYGIDYPGDWHVNDGDTLTACAVFDPAPVDVPEATTIPMGLAIQVSIEDVSYDVVEDAADDPAIEVLEATTGTVDGREATQREVEATGEGLRPEGTASTQVLVDLDDRVLVAQTHDVEEGAPPYPERQELLERMVDTLAFTDGAGGAPDDGADPVAEDADVERSAAEGRAPMVSVTDVRVGAHDGFDRLVLDVAGDSTAGWHVEYVDEPRSAGSGQAVDVDGDAVLRVTATNVQLPPDAPEDVDPWEADGRTGPDGSAVVEVVNDHVYEGHHDLWVGVDEELPFVVQRLEDPQRIVVDLLR